MSDTNIAPFDADTDPDRVLKLASNLSQKIIVVRDACL